MLLFQSSSEIRCVKARGKGRCLPQDRASCPFSRSIGALRARCVPGSGRCPRCARQAAPSARP